MSAPKKQWLLKVIAGPHQGAEMSMREGKLLIGSDDECDVVLHDVLVAPQHVEIEITANAITAAQLGGRVFINGKRLRDARQSIPDFAFVSVGGSHLVIGPEAAKWPLLSAADVPELEKEVEAPAAEAPKTEAPAAADSATPAATPATSVKPARQPSRAAAYFGIGAGVVLLLGWLVAYQMYLSGSPKAETTQAPAATKPVDRARAVIASLGMTDSMKVEESAGRLSVSGYVDTESRQRELQSALRDAVPGVHTRIYSLEKIGSTAMALLDDQHLPLTVTTLSEGKLKITGKLASAEPWVRMRQTLQRSVPGISAIEDGVEIDAPRPIAMPRPVSVVAAAPAPPPVVVSVPVTPKLAPAAAPAAPEVPPADYHVTADTIDTPEATIATIKTSENAISFVRLSTGGVYFVGARLPFGGKVARIEANTVTIEEHGTSRTLQRGDLVMKPKGSASSTTFVAP